MTLVQKKILSMHGSFLMAESVDYDRNGDQAS